MGVERTVREDGTVVEVLTDEDARWDLTNEQLEQALVCSSCGYREPDRSQKGWSCANCGDGILR